MASPSDALLEWRTAAIALRFRTLAESNFAGRALVSAVVQPTFELVPSETGSGSPDIRSALQSGSRSGVAGPSRPASSG